MCGHVFVHVRERVEIVKNMQLSHHRYFAILAPAVTFGGLLEEATSQRMVTRCTLTM